MMYRTSFESFEFTNFYYSTLSPIQSTVNSVVDQDNREKVLKIVELLHKENVSQMSDLVQNTDMRIVFPNVQDGKIEKKRNKMFTCLASEEEQDDQSNVWMDSELKELKGNDLIFCKKGKQTLQV